MSSTQTEPDFEVDPAEAYVLYRGTKYYRDGILYGRELGEERSIPTLWSTLVINYRKKAIEVEAIQLLPTNAEEVAAWCGGRVVEEIDPETEKRYVGINIPTLMGVIRASEEDYVVKDASGAFLRYKPDEFAREFELF